MSLEKTITAIDIWSSKIRTIIWSFSWEKNDKFMVLWIWISNSTAIRKWNILDMEEFKDNIDKSLEEAEKMAGQQVSSAYISLNSSSFDILTNRWVIAISWDEITQDDVDRVLDMTKSWVDFPNREILKVIPEVFSVDIEDWVKNPIGMSARKLEVTAKIFSINTNVLNNIKKCINDVWIEVLDVYPNLLSSPEWVLTRRQKELWVVCIDIWASTTWVTVYEEWILKHSAIIPLGWDNVTNDIALWLRTSTLVAEKLKIEQAVLSTKDKPQKEKKFNLSKLNMWEDLEIDLQYLSQIATARYEEIFQYIREELKAIWKDGMLPEWAVFVWWAVKVKNFLDSAKQNLKLPCFVWTPEISDEMTESFIHDPVYAAIIWTLLLANKYWVEETSININFSWIIDSILKFLKKLLP